MSGTLHPARPVFASNVTLIMVGIVVWALLSAEMPSAEAIRISVTEESVCLVAQVANHSRITLVAFETEVDVA